MLTLGVIYVKASYPCDIHRYLFRLGTPAIFSRLAEFRSFGMLPGPSLAPITYDLLGSLRALLKYCHAERHVSDSSLNDYRDCFSAWIALCGFSLSIHPLRSQK